MDRVTFSGMRLGPKRRSLSPALAQWCFFALFAGQFLLVWLGLLVPRLSFAGTTWPDGLLLILATASVCASLARRLPLQNVIAACFIVVVLGGAANCLNALTGLPFGPCTYTERLGKRLFDPLPWSLPLVWVTAILSSRETARLLLRPWRQARSYGLWVLACTVALALTLDLAMEPFAVVIRGYWLWHPIKLQGDWYGAPWTNFLGWAMTATVILTFVTPFLIQKKPGNSSTDYLCPVLWASLMGFFATSAAVHRLQSALLLTVAIGATVLMLIIAAAILSKGRGARRHER